MSELIALEEAEEAEEAAEAEAAAPEPEMATRKPSLDALLAAAAAEEEGAAPQLSPQYVLSAARLAEIQAEYHADDIEIDRERMARWSEARVRAYFEAGGVDHLSLWKRVSARDVAGSSNSNGSGRDESPLNSRRFSVATAAHLMQRKGSPRFSDRLNAHLGEIEAAAAEEEAAPSRRRYSMRLTSHLLEKAQGEANGDGGAPHHALASRTSFEDELLAEASKCAAAAVTIQSAQRAKYDRALAAAMESLIGGEGYAASRLQSLARGKKTRRIVAEVAPAAAAAAEVGLRLTLASPDGNRRKSLRV